MSDDLYFDGDPATDSARRHLERVLKEPERPRRWPWVIATATALAAWYLWPRRRADSSGPHASGEAIRSETTTRPPTAARR
jgi:hypothetical protein